MLQDHLYNRQVHATLLSYLPNGLVSQHDEGHQSCDEQILLAKLRLVRLRKWVLENRNLVITDETRCFIELTHAPSFELKVALLVRT